MRRKVPWIIIGTHRDESRHSIRDLRRLLSSTFGPDDVVVIQNYKPGFDPRRCASWDVRVCVCACIMWRGVSCRRDVDEAALHVCDQLYMRLFFGGLSEK